MSIELLIAVSLTAVFFLLTLCLLHRLQKQKKYYGKIIEELVDEMQHDYLTGLLSRKAFIEGMEAQLSDDPEGILLIFDVNGFKTVNDTFGHKEGDNLIKRYAEKLQKGFENELVGRLGGDEFLVFISGKCDKEELNARIKSAGVAEFPDLPTKLTLTSCCGVALSPQNGTSFDELYRMADKALYHSKKTTHRIVYCK